MYSAISTDPGYLLGFVQLETLMVISMSCMLLYLLLIVSDFHHGTLKNFLRSCCLGRREAIHDANSAQWFIISMEEHSFGCPFVS